MALNVFASLQEESLHRIADSEGLDYDEDDSKPKILRKIYPVIEEYGVAQLAESLKLVELKDVCKSLHIEHGNNNPKHKVVLKKRLIEKINEEGTYNFFAALPPSTLNTFLTAFGIKSDKSNEETIQQLVEVVYTMGTQTFLGNFDVPFLKQCAVDMKLKCNSESKARIISALISQTSIEPEEKEPVVVSSKKLPIKKGISYQDVFGWYRVEELQTYCKEHGLKASGTKRELIHRILEDLDQDKENAKENANVKEAPKKEDPKKEVPKKEAPKKEEAKTEEVKKEVPKKEPAKKSGRRTQKTETSEDE